MKLLLIVTIGQELAGTTHLELTVSTNLDVTYTLIHGLSYRIGATGAVNLHRQHLTLSLLGILAHTATGGSTHKAHTNRRYGTSATTTPQRTEGGTESSTTDGAEILIGVGGIEPTA
jgi:hypothetical protein